jgi:hypothetical protein
MSIGDISILVVVADKWQLLVQGKAAGRFTPPA